MIARAFLASGTSVHGVRPEATSFTSETNICIIVFMHYFFFLYETLCITQST